MNFIKTRKQLNILSRFLFLFCRQDIDQEVRQVIEDAVKRAKSDKEIGLEELTADISCNPIDTRVRGVTAFDTLSHRRLGPAVNNH